MINYYKNNWQNVMIVKEHCLFIITPMLINSYVMIHNTNTFHAFYDNLSLTFIDAESFTSSQNNPSAQVSSAFNVTRLRWIWQIQSFTLSFLEDVYFTICATIYLQPFHVLNFIVYWLAWLTDVPRWSKLFTYTT